MTNKKQVLEAMDKVELFRASTMLTSATDRVNKAFEGVKRVCEYRKQEETIGFEGNEWFKCNNPKHPYAKSIYPSCMSKHCTYAKD